MDEYLLFQYAQLFVEATCGAYTMEQALQAPLYLVMMTIVSKMANNGVDLYTVDRLSDIEANMKKVEERR